MSLVNHVVNQSSNPAYLNRREFLSYMLIACIILSAGLLLAVTIYITAPPAHNFHYIGDISDYPPSRSPYSIHINQDRLWLINTGTDLIIFAGRTPHRTNHPIEWVDVTQRFEDPLTGGKFTINGDFLGGPVIRDMDRYEVITDNEQIFVDTSKVIIGANACQKFSSQQWCNWLYKTQTQYIKHQ